MKIINASYEINKFNPIEMLKTLERIGRVCYKSEDKITIDSAEKFVKMIIKRGHLSVLEHASITVKFICDRGISHEIVRHRIAAYSQESTRYCNYAKEKFGNEITVIVPFFFNNEQYHEWYLAMCQAEKSYMQLLKLGATPQKARTVLPNSLKTEINVTYNLRQWLHFLKLRTHESAHPQMRELIIPLQKDLQKLLPCIFKASNT